MKKVYLMCINAQEIEGCGNNSLDRIEHGAIYSGTKEVNLSDAGHGYDIGIGATVRSMEIPLIWSAKRFIELPKSITLERFATWRCGGLSKPNVSVYY